MNRKGNFINLEKDTIENMIIYKNIDQSYIFTTEDKLKIIISDFIHKWKKKNGYGIPLSLSITLVITILTSDFKNIFSISGYTWESLFISGCVFSFIWLIISLYKCFTVKKCSIESVINEIKNKTTSQT